MIKDAITKYGKQNFFKEILRQDIENQSLLDKWEQLYINKYKSTDKTIGYNIAKGSVLNGITNPTKLQVVKDKISATMLLKHQNLEFKEKSIKGMRSEEGCLNRIKSLQTPEFRIEQSERFKGKFAGDKNPMYGKSQSQLCKDTVSKIMKERHSGTSWYNNGIDHIRVKSCEEIRPGFVKGRIVNWSNKSKQ